MFIMIRTTIDQKKALGATMPVHNGKPSEAFGEFQGLY